MYCPLHSPWPFFSIRPAHASYSTNALLHAVDLEHFSSMAIFGSTGSSSSSTSAGTIVRWSDIAKSWIAKSWAALRVSRRPRARRRGQQLRRDQGGSKFAFFLGAPRKLGAAQKAFAGAIIAL